MIVGLATGMTMTAGIRTMDGAVGEMVDGTVDAITGGRTTIGTEIGEGGTGTGGIEDATTGGIGGGGEAGASPAARLGAIARSAVYPAAQSAVHPAAQSAAYPAA